MIQSAVRNPILLKYSHVLNFLLLNVIGSYLITLDRVCLDTLSCYRKSYT